MSDLRRPEEGIRIKHRVNSNAVEAPIASSPRELS
jgi:hypothetical protein